MHLFSHINLLIEVYLLTEMKLMMKIQKYYEISSNGGCQIYHLSDNVSLHYTDKLFLYFCLNEDLTTILGGWTGGWVDGWVGGCSE